MSYKVITRKQFTFTTNDKNLSCLLTANIIQTNDSVLVNIVGMFIQRVECGNIFVTITVGPSDPNAMYDQSYESQLTQFRQNLHSLSIKYHESQILQIFNIEVVNGTPGAFRIPIIALTCAGVPIRNSYIGEPIPNDIMSIFIEVPRRYIIKALEIIRNINVANPDLCINTNNYVAKCICNQNNNDNNKCGCVCVDQDEL